MKTQIRILIMLLFSFFIFSSLTFANSMEPPGLVIILEGTDEVDSVWLAYEDKIVEGVKKKWPLETQYWFYNNEGYNNSNSVILNVSGANKKESYTLTDLKQYHTTYTVNLANGKIIEGKSLWRTLVLVSSRLVLTLLIESLIFFLFRFRERISWIIFIGINIMTQLTLNIYINSLAIAISYPVFILIITEFWVFLAEAITFPLFIREHSVKRRIGVALLGNFASLVLGGYIISTWLPI